MTSLPSFSTLRFAASGVCAVALAIGVPAADAGQTAIAARAAAPAVASLHLRSIGLTRRSPREESARAWSARARPASAASDVQPLDPTQIRTAYGLPASGARGQTVAIVIAGDAPNIEADMKAYDAQWGLPSCSFSNGCLRKLNQQGKASPLPTQVDSNWVTEAAIGTEVVHGLCQTCRIILEEANSFVKFEYSPAVKAAADAGATVIVTTLAQGEEAQDSSYIPDYQIPRAVVVSAAGDATGTQYGYIGQPDFPSALPSVLAVGGTVLTTRPSGAYVQERAWNGTVSGCSFYQLAPAWQGPDARSVGCRTNRAVADIAAMSKPGAAVHVTDSGAPGGPWFAATGTSLAAPIIGAVIGLAGSAGAGEAKMLYERAQREAAAFHDVTTGGNALNCTSAICRAGRGYDGPTGLGTPFGLAAFLPSGGALDRHHPRVTTTVTGGALRLNGRWQAAVRVLNGNPFGVSGSVTIRIRRRLGGRTRFVPVASGRIELPPLGEQRLTLTAVQYRRLVRQLGSAQANLQLQIRGPVGPRIVSIRQVVLLAP